MTGLTLTSAAQVHVGRVREHNEDALLARQDLGLYVVADGAGGHNAGEVASALALRSIENYVGATVREAWNKPEWDNLGIANGGRRLVAAVLKANRDVIEISKRSERHRGMGTTVVAASFSPRSEHLHIAHVGDSRCYRLRGGFLEQLTSDHSLINDVLEQRPELDDAVLERLPRNVVTRALGVDPQLRVPLRSIQVAAGDQYLLCSDGLSGPVPADRIAALLSGAATPEAATEALIEAALDAGGPDNIAAVVMRCAGQAIEGRATLPGFTTLDDFDAPELLLVGIDELELSAVHAWERASDELIRALTNRKR